MFFNSNHGGSLNYKVLKDKSFFINRKEFVPGINDYGWLEIDIKNETEFNTSL